MIEAGMNDAKNLREPCTKPTINFAVDLEQIKKIRWTSQTNEQYTLLGLHLFTAYPTSEGRRVQSGTSLTADALAATQSR